MIASTWLSRSSAASIAASTPSSQHLLDVPDLDPGGDGVVVHLRACWRRARGRSGRCCGPAARPRAGSGPDCRSSARVGVAHVEMRVEGDQPDPPSGGRAHARPGGSPHCCRRSAGSGRGARCRPRPPARIGAKPSAGITPAPPRRRHRGRQDRARARRQIVGAEPPQRARTVSGARSQRPGVTDPGLHRRAEQRDRRARVVGQADRRSISSSCFAHTRASP